MSQSVRLGALLACLLVGVSARANTIVVNVPISATDPGTIAYVPFTVTSAGTFSINADGSGAAGLGSSFVSDPQIHLFGKTVTIANLVDSDDDGGAACGLCSEIVQFLAKGNYVLAVSEFSFSAADAVAGSNAGDVDDPGLIRITIESLDGFFELLNDAVISGLATAAAVMDGGDFVGALPLHGAHHRPLLRYRGLENGRCAWASGDLAHYGRQHDADAALIEIGGCYDFVPDRLRVGVGIGKSYVSQDLSFGGNSHLDGEYVLAEVDYRFAGMPLIASLTGSYGRWDADVDRGYIGVSGAADQSFGDTGVFSVAVRGRLDWVDAFRLADASITPRVEVSVIHSEVDRFGETGGSLPAFFDERSRTAKEVRFGLDGERQVGGSTWLRAMIEGSHRFDDDESVISGTLGGLGFAVPVRANEDTWGRIGVEIEHHFWDTMQILGSINGSTKGEDPAVSGGVNLIVSF